MFMKIANFVGGVPVIPAKRVKQFTMTNGEAAVKGRMYTVTAGRLTKATAKASDVMLIAEESLPGGIDVNVRASYVAPGDVFRANAIGTKHASFTVGITLAEMDANGENVNWALGTASTPVAAGALTVLHINEADSTVEVVFNKSAFAT